MKLKLTLFFAAISSSVFAANLASLSVDASSPSSVRVTAPANALDSTSELYLVWAEGDCGNELEAWPAANRIKYDGAVSDAAATYVFDDLSAIPAGSAVRVLAKTRVKLLDGSVRLNGFEFVDTGIRSTEAYGIAVKVNIHGYNGEWAPLVGATWENFDIGRRGKDNGKLYMRHRGNIYDPLATSGTMRSDNVSDAYIHTIAVTNQTAWFDGAAVKTGLAAGSLGTRQWTTILLGAGWNLNEDESRVDSALYVNASWFYATIFGADGGAVRNLLPAKCGTRACFYDTVSGKAFFPQGSGSSSFAGNATNVTGLALASAASPVFSVGVHAYWTGQGDRDDVSDAANWACTNNLGEAVSSVAPSVDTIIHIEGATSFNMPEGQSLAYRTLYTGDVVLSDDCDWRGFSSASTLAWGDSVALVDRLDAYRTYFNTGFKPNRNTRVVMDVDVNAKDEYWFGAWNSAYNNGAYAAGNDDGGVYAGFGNSGGTGGGLVQAGRHTLEYSLGVLSVDGSAYRTVSYGNSFQVNYPLFLFAQNRKGAVAWRLDFSGVARPIRFYSCRIYDSGTLARDFVPAVHGPSCTPCLYAKVAGKVYEHLGAGTAYTGIVKRTEPGAITNEAFCAAAYCVDARPSIGGTVDLNGHTLYVATNQSVLAVTDSAGGGELVFDGAKLNAGVTASGAATVTVLPNCASGAGAFAMGAGTTLSLPQVGIVSLGGNLTLASGAKLAFKLDHGSETTLSLASAPNLPDSGTVVVEFEEDSAFAPDKTYTLISGGNFQASDKGKFALPQGDRGKLDVDASGNLVYIAPKYFLINVR